MQHLSKNVFIFYCYYELTTRNNRKDELTNARPRLLFALPYVFLITPRHSICDASREQFATCGNLPHCGVAASFVAETQPHACEHKNILNSVFFITFSFFCFVGLK